MDANAPASTEARNLLRCPRCKGTLALSDGAPFCESCRERFPVDPGATPMYHLYADENPQEPGRDPAQVWDRARFEEGFERIGYHESGAEFDRQLGYPQEVSDFLFERVKRRMLDHLTPVSGHRILDVGCGAGYLLYLIGKKYAERGCTIPLMAGIEISTVQLSYAIRRMEKEGIHDFLAVHGSGEYLPFADESFDLITCSEVLEHMRNPGRALTEMRRLLKPNGLLILSTPSMSAQRGWGYVLAPIAVPVKLLRGYRPTPSKEGAHYDIPWYADEFSDTIRYAGFHIDRFEYNAVIPHPWHFRFLPRALVKPVVGLFSGVDRYLKFALKPLALHFVVTARKADDVDRARMPRGRVAAAPDSTSAGLAGPPAGRS